MKDRALKFFCVLLVILLAVSVQQANAQESCQYRRMEINDPTTGPTVIHIRTTRGQEVREFGYHDSGVYPWSVEYEWCGAGWVVEFRLGSGCTFWNGEHMQRAKDGVRQRPCTWSEWEPAEFTTGESPPGAPVILAKLESLS